ncbi:hypothetical protein J830_4668, partial [Acinetobacter baumannii 25691_7]
NIIKNGNKEILKNSKKGKAIQLNKLIVYKPFLDILD